MLMLYGILGLIQVTLLPALIVMKAGKLRGGITEQLIRLLPISLIVNYLLIFLLAALHLYIRPVMLVIIAAELVCIFLLYLGTLFQPVGFTVPYFRCTPKRISAAHGCAFRVSVRCRRCSTSLDMADKRLFRAFRCPLGIPSLPSEFRHGLQRLGYTLFLECLCRDLGCRQDPGNRGDVPSAGSLELVSLLFAAGRKCGTVFQYAAPAGIFPADPGDAF